MRGPGEKGGPGNRQPVPWLQAVPQIPLRGGHVRSCGSPDAADAATAEVEEYVWVSNAKGPVTVATTGDGTRWLIDNRVPSSANPHVAVNEWIKSWRATDGAATA